MFTQPQYVILFTFIGVSLFWLLPNRATFSRKIIVIITSLLLIGFVSIQAVIYTVGLSIFAWLISSLYYRFVNSRWGSNKKLRIIIFWAFIIALISPLMFLEVSNLTSAAKWLIPLGLSYVTLRCISLVIDAKRSPPQDIVNILAYNLFFPTFSSGPIEEQSKFVDDNFRTPFNSKLFLQGGIRVLIGLTAVYFLGQELLLPAINSLTDRITGSESYGLLVFLSYVYLKFIHLFVNFSGYSSIAIGFGAFFGFHILENFNRPYLAVNPQDFWSRWHMSLARFMNKYIYMQLPFAIRRPYLSLIIVFVLVGLWHSISLGYLLWGLGHSGYLIVFSVLKRKYKKNFKKLTSIQKLPIYVFGWFFTMNWIAFLSIMANSPELSSFFQMIQEAIL